MALSISIIFPTIGDVVSAEDDVTEITILHTNDTHSRIEEGVGFSRVATKAKELKEEGKNLLLLDVGDTLHGLPVATISKGKSIVDIMNTVGYDAMVPGNHDFNYGYGRLLELKARANFPILASNLVRENGGRDFPHYIIKDIDGVKVGIFGLVTPETKYKSNPKNTEGVNIEDPIAVSKNMVEQLKNEGADVIIALSHLGLDVESDVKSLDIAREVEGIDLIVDGHSHTALKNGKVEGNTLIVQTGNYMDNLGIVNIKIENGEIIEKTASLITAEEAKTIEEDEKVKKLIDSIKAENEKITSEVIGETKVRLDGEREKVRAGETNLANLITDIMLKEGEADLVITNGGGIRDSIEAGKITKGDVIKVLPFGNYLVVKEVKGIDVLNALEHGTRSYPELAGGFPQVAGMTYKIDLNKEVGNRVHSVEVQNKPLDLNKTYKLATNDFMAAGGDGYTMLGDGKLIAEYPGLDEIVANHIKELGIIDITVEHRMIVEEEATGPEPVPGEDKKLAGKVEKMINNLPQKITLNDKKAIEEAREAFDALTEEQQKLVKNIDKLIAAEKKLTELEKEKPEQEPKPKKSKDSKEDNEKTEETDKGGLKGMLPKTGENIPWVLNSLFGMLLIMLGWRIRRQ
nr:5'-nucleotidase C-terminal domain-containing protein [Anaerosalibacter bizertensis]